MPFVTYPAGFATVLPLDGRSKPNLDKAYEYLTEAHSDELVSGGHDALPDTSSGRSEIPPGSLAYFERRSNGWQQSVQYATGGMSMTPAAYKSLATAFDLLKMNHAVD
ncbi:MAG TPA: hypothetical protein VGN60_02880 [Devosia sp.]|nr:hypothetical protein [Devosia sp.]